MASTTHTPPDSSRPELAESVRRGHEVRDAMPRPVLTFVIVMFAVGGMIHWALWGLLSHERVRNQTRDDAPTIWTADRVPPPEPRLQPSRYHPQNPRVDMEILTKRWQAELTTDGPSLCGDTHLRIPIDRAIDFAVEHGLPARLTTRPTGGMP